MKLLGNAFLEALLRTASEGVVVQDLTGRIVFCNKAAERILGIAEGLIVGNTSHGLEGGTTREDGSGFPAAEHPAMVTLATGEPCTNVIMGVQHDPARPRTWISINSSIIPGPPGAPRRALAVFSDITPHIEANIQLREGAEHLRQANRALHTTETYLRNVLRGIPDPTWMKDRNGDYLFCNAAFEKLYNAREADIVGKTDYDFTNQEQANFFRSKDAEAMQASIPCTNEEWVTFLNDGSRVLLETIKTPVCDQNGVVIGVLGIARDVTERRNLEDRLRATNAELEKLTGELRELARTDPLTGLPNRRAFIEAIDIEFGRSRRFNSPASVLVIDVDHFKAINDDFGHESGDRALVALGALLKNSIRGSDVAARLGGEEFVMLLPGTPLSGATSAAERLRVCIAKLRIESEAGRFGLTVSIGVTPFSPNDRDWSQAVSRADAALYRAKSHGRNKVEIAPVIPALSSAVCGE